MRLATIRTEAGTSAATAVSNGFIEIEEFPDVSALLADPEWRSKAERAAGRIREVESVELAAVVPHPGKVICAGLNFRGHILEMGREVPAFPTLFAKFADTLTGPCDPIALPAEDPCVDWEGELAVVIGLDAFRVGPKEAHRHIAGYTIANDISMRVWQNRTLEWLQGKIWSRTTPVGPVVVTADEFQPDSAVLETRLNGELVQQHALSDFVFSPTELIAYVSTMIPLRAGDLLLTGTPGGIGHARNPQLYLKPGDQIEVAIDGLGTLSNSVVAAESLL